MKKMSKFLLGVAMVLIAVMTMPSCSNEQARVVPEVNITSAVNSADGLDFQLVGGLFQDGTVQDANSLEQELNKDGGINNLDLNGDGDIDFINVSENEGNATAKSFDLTAGEGDESTYLGTVEVEKGADGTYNIHMNGSEEVYGSDYQYSSNYRPSVGQMLFYSWLFSPRPRYYHSPYYRGHYPSYYGGTRIVVGRSAYMQRTSTQRTTTKRTVTKNTKPRKSTIKSKNKGKVGKSARKSISNNKKSQKSFKKRNTNKAVKKGGFSKNKSSASKSSSKKKPTRKSSAKKSSSKKRSSARKSSPKKRSSSRSSSRRSSSRRR